MKRTEHISPAEWKKLTKAAETSHQFAATILKCLGGYRQASLDRATDVDNLKAALDVWRAEHVIVLNGPFDAAAFQAEWEKLPKDGRITVIKRDGDGAEK